MKYLMERYYYNDETEKVITRKEFEDLMIEYIENKEYEEDEEELTFIDVEEYYDSVMYLGKFACIEDATEYYQENYMD